MTVVKKAMSWGKNVLLTYVLLQAHLSMFADVFTHKSINIYLKYFHLLSVMQTF